MSKSTLVLIGGILGLCITICWQRKHIQRITQERDSYQNNTYVLLSDMEELRKDSMSQAYQVQALSLNLDEYKKYRAEDAKTIAELNIKLKQISTVAQQQLKVEAPIIVPVKDSIIIDDSIPQKLKSITFQDDYISLDGIIRNDSLIANFNVPIKITQVLYKVPKHKFLWWSWGCKAVKQVVITNNPYVHLKYSEYIEIK